MNKKIMIGITIAIVAVAATVVSLKTTMGDKATELPGEEHAETALNVQETNQSTSTSSAPGGSGSESTESGP